MRTGSALPAKDEHTRLQPIWVWDHSSRQRLVRVVWVRWLTEW